MSSRAAEISQIERDYTTPRRKRCCNPTYVLDTAFIALALGGAGICSYGYLAKAALTTATSLAYKGIGYTMAGTGAFAELSWRCLGGAEIGRLTAQVNKMSGLVLAVDKERKELAATRQAIESERTQLHGEVGSLKGERAQLHEEVGTLRESVTRLEQSSARERQEAAKQRADLQQQVSAIKAEKEEMIIVVHSLNQEASSFNQQNRRLLQTVEKEEAVEERREKNEGQFEKGLEALKEQFRTTQSLFTQILDEKAVVKGLLGQLEKAEARRDKAEERLFEKLGSVEHQLEETEGKMEKTEASMAASVTNTVHIQELVIQTLQEKVNQRKQKEHEV